MKTQEQLKKEYDERVKWFTDRVGKTIWRPHDCLCEACERIYREGLGLVDLQHAKYVAHVSIEQGCPYFDTEQDRDIWNEENPDGIIRK